eukprot:4754563-Amphidinium_carterae.1
MVHKVAQKVRLPATLLWEADDVADWEQYSALDDFDDGMALSSNSSEVECTTWELPQDALLFSE